MPISNAYTSKKRDYIAMFGIKAIGIIITENTGWTNNWYKYEGGMYYKSIHLAKLNSSVTHGHMGCGYLERYSQWDIEINIPGYSKYTFKMSPLYEQDALIYGGNRWYNTSGTSGGINAPYVNDVAIANQMYDDFDMRNTQSMVLLGWTSIGSSCDGYVDPPASSGDYNRGDTVCRGLSKTVIDNAPAISSILDEAKKVVDYDILGFSEHGKSWYDYYMDRFTVSGTRYIYTVSMINTYVRFYTYVDPTNDIMYNNAHMESPDVTYSTSYFSTNYTNVLNVDVPDSDLIYHYFIGLDKKDEYMFYLSDAQINSWKQNNPNGKIVGEYEYRLPSINRSALPDLDDIEKCKARLGTISNGFFSVPSIMLKLDKYNMRAGAYLADEEVFYTVYRRTSPRFSNEYNKYYKVMPLNRTVTEISNI